MATREDVQQAFKRVLERFEPRRVILTGLMGARFNNEEVVNVANQPGFVYVRVHGNESSVVKAANEATAVGYNLPVRLVRDELEPRSFRVIGRNHGAYPIWAGQTSTWLADHAAQHQFGGGDQAGRDVVWVHKRQFTPLMARPTSGTTHMYVEDDFYEWEDELKYFPGQFSPDMAPYRPTGGYGRRYATLYLDGDDELVKILQGDEFRVIPPPTGTTYENISVIGPEVGINLCAVLLATGTTSIWWDSTVDIRPIVGAPGTAYPRTWLELTDTPDAYAQGDRLSRVNHAADALRLGPRLFTLSRDIDHASGTWYDLWVDGISGTYMDVGADTAWTFIVPVVGLEAGATQRFSHQLQGIVWNDGGSVSGTYGKINLHESVTGTFIRAAFYDGDDTLRIQVRRVAPIGLTGWAATVQLAEVAAPT